MRGRDHQRGHLGGYVNPEAMVPPDHPLRQIRPLVNAALARLSPDFDQLYSLTGRPSIPPEQLLRALLLQAFFTVRSERQLIEQLRYNILFRWFVGLSIEAPVWDVTVFTKTRYSTPRRNWRLGWSELGGPSCICHSCPKSETSVP
jgi:transposase